MSFEERRRNILAKKRSARADLIAILRAQEPTISLVWGGLILPFTIYSNENVYDFGPLISLLRRYKPAHLGYSFRVEPKKEENSGYTVLANLDSRYKIRLELLCGTAR